MKYEHDAIVVLSNTLTPKRELSPESLARMDRGIQLFQDGLAGLLVMNGGPGYYTEKTAEGIRVPRGSHPVQADVMKEYALGQGVPENVIRVQDYSSDTVGEAHFVNGMVLHPERLNKILIVTSRHHIKRCGTVYHAALGPKFVMAFDETISVPHERDPGVLEHEVSSLSMFIRQFADIKPGDFAAFETRLYEQHGLYSKIPEDQRLRCFT